MLYVIINFILGVCFDQNKTYCNLFMLNVHKIQQFELKLQEKINFNLLNLKTNSM